MVPYLRITIFIVIKNFISVPSLLLFSHRVLRLRFFVVNYPHRLTNLRTT